MILKNRRSRNRNNIDASLANTSDAMFVQSGYNPPPPVVERPKTRKEMREERMRLAKMQKEAQLQAEKLEYERPG